jgi:hypothetical protein
LAKLLMQEIQKVGLTPDEAKDLVIQCFDLNGLKQFSVYMRQAGYDIPMVLLVECSQGLPDLNTMEQLKALSTEAGIGYDSLRRLPFCVVHFGCATLNSVNTFNTLLTRLMTMCLSTCYVL